MLYIRDFVPLMQDLYRLNDYPSDRLFRDPLALACFTREFNNESSGVFATADVAAELERIRKDKKGTGGLPRVGRKFSGPTFYRNDGKAA